MKTPCSSIAGSSFWGRRERYFFPYACLRGLRFSRYETFFIRLDVGFDLAGECLHFLDAEKLRQRKAAFDDCAKLPSGERALDDCPSDLGVSLDLDPSGVLLFELFVEFAQTVIEPRHAGGQV